MGLSNDANAAVSEAVEKLLRKAGTSGLRALSHCLQDSNAELRARAAHYLTGSVHLAEWIRPAVERALEDKALAVRVNSCLALYVDGADLPILRDVLAQALEENGPSVFHARWMMEGFGERSSWALPALVKSSRSASMRGAREETLLALGPMSVAGLVELLQDANEYVRAHAAYLIKELGPIAVEAVPALAVALADPSDRVRVSSGSALGSIGHGAVVAAPALLQAAHSPREELAVEALLALGQLGAGAQAVVPGIVARTSAGSPAIRAAAVEALVGVCPDAGDGLTALAQALEDASAEVRKAAARACLLWAPESVPLRPRLVAHMQDHSFAVRVWVGGALFALDSTRTDILEYTARPINVHDYDGENLRDEVLQLFTALGEAARPITATILQGYFDASSITWHEERGRADRERALFLRVLQQTGLPAKDWQVLVEAMRGDEMLDDDEPRWRRALQAVAAIPSPPPNVLDGLCALLRSPDSDRRLQALRAFEGMGYRARPFAAAIEVLLTDPRRDVRVAACLALNVIERGRRTVTR